MNQSKSTEKQHKPGPQTKCGVRKQNRGCNVMTNSVKRLVFQLNGK